MISHDDDQSETAILEDRIKRTDQVRVSYDKAKRNEEWEC